MQANRMPRNECGDAAAQRAVLSLVLEAHPEPLTVPELAQELDGDGDSVERAVVALVGVGLLECGGLSVHATDAALRHDRLELP
jgi:DNA-binding IclR family transcriptional regulator